MLKHSRLARHFEFFGDTRRHFCCLKGAAAAAYPSHKPPPPTSPVVKGIVWKSHLSSSRFYWPLAMAPTITSKALPACWGRLLSSYRNALLLSSLATFAGALVALVMAHGLVASFSGKGLVPPSALSAHGFMFAVACAAALTHFSATRLGLPVSTTHAPIGWASRAGLGIVGTVNWAPLLQVFALPLLLSPPLAAAIGAPFVPDLAKLPIEDACVCVRADPSAALPGHGAVHMSRCAG